jgi:pyruvate/2-oxoglutarate dehydrogenase complex dihydrolipoamide acyltransferase (E2) component
MVVKRSMAVQNITLPDLGEGTKEATIKEVYVKVGDVVEEVSS